MNPTRVSSAESKFNKRDKIDPAASLNPKHHLKDFDTLNSDQDAETFQHLLEEVVTHHASNPQHQTSLKKLIQEAAEHPHLLQGIDKRLIENLLERIDEQKDTNSSWQDLIETLTHQIAQKHAKNNPTDKPQLDALLAAQLLGAKPNKVDAPVDIDKPTVAATEHKLNEIVEKIASQILVSDPILNTGKSEVIIVFKDDILPSMQARLSRKDQQLNITFEGEDQDTVDFIAQNQVLLQQTLQNRLEEPIKIEVKDLSVAKPTTDHQDHHQGQSRGQRSVLEEYKPDEP